MLMDIATDDCAGAKACGQLTGLHGRVIAFLADQGLPPSRVVAAHTALHPENPPTSTATGGRQWWENARAELGGTRLWTNDSLSWAPAARPNDQLIEPDTISGSPGSSDHGPSIAC